MRLIRSKGSLQLLRLEARPLRASGAASGPRASNAPGCLFLGDSVPRRGLAHVQERGKVLSDVWFTGSWPVRRPEGYGGERNRPPDERTLKLGKTLRILQARLPTLLQTPLPQEVLSPQISLHLFPSTHPHLPTASGRVSYVAALWTAPMAWGRVPIVGNVRLRILSERMVPSGPPASSAFLSSGGPSHTSKDNYRSEKLVVRWTTMGKPPGRGSSDTTKTPGTRTTTPSSASASADDRITRWLGIGRSYARHEDQTGADTSEEDFTGLFVFEFDEQGRIVRHTIERAEEGGLGEGAAGPGMTGVFGLGEWLLRRVGAGARKGAEAEAEAEEEAGRDRGDLPGGLQPGVCMVEGEDGRDAVAGWRERRVWSSR